MPLIQSPSKNIYLWKIDEELPQLKTLAFQNKIQHNASNYKALSRQKEHIATRLLLNTILKNTKLQKDKNGKPFLSGNNGFISISHNSGYVAIYLSDKNCGIDIQEPTKKTLFIKPRFINTADYSFHSNDPYELSVTWAAKEAAFKKYGEHALYIKEHISIIQKKDAFTYLAKVNIGDTFHFVQLKLLEVNGQLILYTL